MGENICKRSNRQAINFQNIQTAHAVLGQKKNKQPIKKCVEGLNRHFSKDNIQMANKVHEKMLNITSYYRNENQNCNEVITSHQSEWSS